MAYWADRVHTHGPLLDLGCGEGDLLERLGENSFGVDLNPKRLIHAAQRRLPVALADGCSLPFVDNIFETVISMEVLEHVPQMERVMREANRVLDAGGCWLVSVPSVTLRSRYEMWREKRPHYCDEDEHYREFTQTPIHGFEHRFMTMARFIRQFEENGFELVARDGVRYLFPQWLSRLPSLQRLLESPRADRLWTRMPWIRRFPYWTILLLRKRGVAA